MTEAVKMCLSSGQRDSRQPGVLPTLVVWLPTDAEDVTANVTVQLPAWAGWRACFSVKDMMGVLIASAQLLCVVHASLVVPNVTARPLFLVPRGA